MYVGSEPRHWRTVTEVNSNILPRNAEESSTKFYHAELVLYPIILADPYAAYHVSKFLLTVTPQHVWLVEYEAMQHLHPQLLYNWLSYYEKVCCGEVQVVQNVISKNFALLTSISKRSSTIFFLTIRSIKTCMDVVY